MSPLQPYEHVQLMHLVAAYIRTSRHEREIADRRKEADVIRSAAPSQPPHASRLGLRALVGRLARRAAAQA